ncbi:MAG: calcium-binding protein [Hyphomicrobiaceae bacterium]
MAIKRGTNARDRLFGTAAADQIFGLGGNDDLFGRKGNDKLFGGSGNDKLFGEDGNDLLDGGTGTDTMKGGKGNDTYVVDRTTDKAIELAGQGTDIVKSSVSFTIGANVEHLVLTGTKAINGTLSSSVNEVGNSLTGNAKANNLNGGLGHDVLIGKAGADTLNGGDGNDTLLPGAGAGVADIINGGNGFDTVDYRDALGGVLVDLGTNNFAGHASGDSIALVENVVGSRFADDLTASGVDGSFVFGGAGNDILRGNNTAFYDRLRGDDGVDLLIGGTNEEDFVLQYGRGMDVVQFYRTGGADHVLIDAAEFGLTLAVETRQIIDGVEFTAADFNGGRPAFGTTERLIFDTDSGILWGDKDGAGSAFEAIPIALFSSSSIDPSATDIWLRDL